MTPKDWEVFFIIPVFKLGDNRECQNHRGISLLSDHYKVYSKVLDNWQRSLLEKKLREEKYGFRPNRTQDLILTFKQMSEKVIKKSR